MSPWASSSAPEADAGRRWVVVGNPDGRRVALFQEALTAGEHRRPPAVVVAWADLLAGRADLGDVVRPGDLVRIESPGRDFAVERLLLARGAAEPDEEGDGAYAGIPAAECADLPFRRGEILCPRQWYRGLRSALSLLRDQLGAASRDVTLLNAPAEIALLFDKAACQAHLAAAAGAPIPRPLGIVRGWADLTARMAGADVNRVFVKLAHGSSASGVVAYRRNGSGGRHQAFTTVEEEGGRLYNSRRVRRLTEPGEIAALVDALCRHRVAAEEWLPKADLPGAGAFDVRALVVAGRMRHVVARCSRRSPMTNLHLLNDRAGEEAVRARVGGAAWAQLSECVGRAARAAFPRSLHVGFDVLWTPGFRRLAFLEANAFGDLLPGALHEGESTYEAEVRAAEERAEAAFRPAAAPASVRAC